MPARRHRHYAGDATARLFEGPDDRHDDHGADCGCGHAHAPTPAEVAAATTPQELASLILAVAIRLCSGAVLLLALSWQMGNLPAEIAGAFDMASGRPR